MKALLLLQTTISTNWTGIAREIKNGLTHIAFVLQSNPHSFEGVHYYRASWSAKHIKSLSGKQDDDATSKKAQAKEEGRPVSSMFLHFCGGD